jgi:hypothetical protein
MGKRFADTAIWQKPWFRNLSPVEKTAWFYVTANCDYVGVWDADMILADFIIGEGIDWPELVKKCNGNIQVLPNGKYWLVDFCKFQYGPFRRESNTHRSCIALLERHGLMEQGLAKGYITLLDTDKDKVLDKDKEKDKTQYAEAVHMTAAQHQKLVDKYGSESVSRAVDKLSTYKLAKGRQYKSDYHACLQWVFEAIGAKARTPPKPVAPIVKGERDESVGPMLTDLKARLAGRTGK